MKRSALIVFLISIALSLFAVDFRLTSFVDYYGGVEPSLGYENLRSRIYLAPEITGFADNGLEWHLSGHLYMQPLGEPLWVEPEEILFQGYLFFPTDFFDISLGQKLITLGMADIYGPLNCVNSSGKSLLSLDDPYDSKRSDLALHVQYYPTFDDMIELVYIPIPRADKEQTADVLINRGPLDFTVQWDDNPYLLNNPHSFFAAYTRYSENVDLHFVYGWYTEQTPDFDLDGLSINGGDLIGSSDAVYHRKHTIGGAISTGLGRKYTLTEEVAFNLTEDFEGKNIGIQNSDITVNTQILGNLPGGILGQLNVVYQYFFNFNENQTVYTNEIDQTLAEEIRGFHTQPQQHIAFAICHLEKSFFREKLKTSINAALLYPNVYIGPRVRYRFSDNIKIESGLDFTTGDPAEQKLRRNPNNDNYYVRLTYQF